MQTHSELEDAIEGLYSAFAIYPLPQNTDPCTHCYSEAEEAKLHSKPLRDLELEELRDYMCDALTVWGDDKVFRYFLPRIYELYVTTPYAPQFIVDPEMVFKKFHHGSWREWPQPEQAAIERFLCCFWGAVLLSPPASAPETVDIETWICAVAQAEDDLSDYLRQWLVAEDISATLALSSFLLTSGISLTRRSGRDPWWDGREAQYAQLRKWVYTPEVLNKLEEAANREEWIEHRAEFEAAASMLRTPE